MQHVSKIIPNILANIHTAQRDRYMKLFEQYGRDFERMSKYGDSNRTAQELAELAVLFDARLATGGLA